MENKLFLYLFIIHIINITHFNNKCMDQEISFTELPNLELPPHSPDGWQHGRDREGFKALEKFAGGRSHLMSYEQKEISYSDLVLAEHEAYEKSITPNPDNEIQKLFNITLHNTTTKDSESPSTRTHSAESGRTTTLFSPISPFSKNASPLNNTYTYKYEYENEEYINSLIKFLNSIQARPKDHKKIHEWVKQIKNLSMRIEILFAQTKMGKNVKAELFNAIEEGLQIQTCYKKNFDIYNKEEYCSYRKRIISSELLYHLLKKKEEKLKKTFDVAAEENPKKTIVGFNPQ
jgi:hypothetical protein